MMTLKEFCERLDNLDWTELHYIFFDKLAPHLRDRLYTETLHKASTLLQAAALPPVIAEALLPPPPEADLPSWAYVFAALRQMGHDPQALSTEEALLLYAYVVAKQMDTPQNDKM